MKKQTLEHIRRKVASRKGYRHSEETKRKIGNSNKYSLKGKKLSDETKKKLSDIHKKIGAPWMIGKKQSEETRRKKSIAQKGEKGSNWKGGVYPKNQIIRQSLDYKLWREAVFKRDNWTCVWCGNKFIKGVTGNVPIHADHIKPFSQYPTLRFAIDNGRTLCVPCHRTTESFGGRFRTIKK